MEKSSEQTQPTASFVLYPFGKLYPIFPNMIQFLTLKRQNWLENWVEANNENDYDSMLSLVTILNEWKQCEVYYRVKVKEVRMFGKIRYGRIIFELFGSLLNHQHLKNYKIMMSLTEVFQFFYTKFRNPKQYFSYLLSIDEIIQDLEGFIYVNMTKSKENLEELLSIPQFTVLRSKLTELVIFLQAFDGEMSTTLKEQFKQQALSLLIHLISNRCVPTFLSVMISIKIHFMRFVQTFYKDEWSQFLNNLEQKQNHKVFEEPKNHHSSLQYFYSILSRMQYLRTKPKLFFAYFNILYRWLPVIMLCCGSVQQRRFIFQRVFVITTDGLLKLYEEKKKRQFFVDYKQAELFRSIDLVRNFRNNTLLNDLEMALVSYFEQHIKEHKNQKVKIKKYLQIQDYMQLIQDLKQKFISKLEQLHVDFLKQWQGVGLDEHDNEQKKKKYERINVQSQLQEATITMKTKHPRLNAALNIKSSSRDVMKQNPQRKSNSRGRKIKNGLQMPDIQQVSEEDEQNTGTEDEKRPYKRSKDQKKRPTNQRKSKKSMISNQNDSEEQNTAEELQMKPLQRNRRRSVSSSSTESVQSKSRANSNGKEQSESPLQLQNKSQKGKGFDTSKRPLIMLQNQFCSYYEHHSHQFNVLKIFRQNITRFKKPQFNASYQLYDRDVIRYPEFVNITSLRPQTHNVTDQKPFISTKNMSTIESTEQRHARNEIHKTKFLIKQTIQIGKKELEKRKIKNRDDGKLNKIQKQLKQLHQTHAKNQNKSAFYYIKYLRSPDNIMEIVVRKFPLAQTFYGKLTQRSLLKCVQEFFFHFLKVENPPIPVKTNRFNTNLISLNKMCEANSDSMQLQQVMNLLLALLYEILQILKSSENDSLKFFHNHLFKRLPVSMSSILLFYMFEISRLEYFQFKNIIQVFLEKYLTHTELINLLTFWIEKCKLSGIEMHYSYEKLYVLLSKRCRQMIKETCNLLCNQIVPRVKKEIQINNLQNVQFIKQHLARIQTLKIQFYTNFNHLIDMLKLWAILSCSSMQFMDHLPSKQLQKVSISQQKPLLFYCQICKTLCSLKFHLRNQFNYQQYLCTNCSNGVLNRFELNSFQIHQFQAKNCVNFSFEIDLANNTVMECFDKYTWNVTPMSYHKYNENQAINLQRIMEVQDNPYLSQNQRQKHSAREQRFADNSNRKNERSHSKDSYTSNKSHKTSTQQKNKKSKQQQMQEDNEEFCFNNCQIFAVYLEYIASVVRQYQ